MRVQKKFNPRIDRRRSGSRVIKLSEDIKTRALVFRLTSGEREALITNPGEDEMGEGVFPELYYKRWPVETKYNQVKQKMELENFSGRLAGNIKQDFYAMMTVPDMPASGLREANEKIPEGKTGKRKYEYRANAVGVLKDRLIGMLITDVGSGFFPVYLEIYRRRERGCYPDFCCF